MSNSLRPHGLQHARPPCSSPTPRVHSNSCPLSQWCHPTISSSVFPFSSHFQSFPASGTFQMSQLFISSGQSISVSASTSVLPMNIQDWFPLGWTSWIFLIITWFILLGIYFLGQRIGLFFKAMEMYCPWLSRLTLPAQNLLTMYWTALIPNPYQE